LFNAIGKKYCTAASGWLGSDHSGRHNALFCLQVLAAGRRNRYLAETAIPCVRTGFRTSRGRHGISAIVLGSETVKVLTRSKIPMLVYR